MSVKQAADEMGMGTKGVLALIDSGNSYLSPLKCPHCNQTSTDASGVQRKIRNLGCWIATSNQDRHLISALGRVTELVDVDSNNKPFVADDRSLRSPRGLVQVRPLPQVP